MPDPSSLPSGTEATGYPSYDRSPSQALAETPEEVRAAWRSRYLTDPEAEGRVLALLERAEAALHSGNTPVTIRTLWMALADRAGRSEDSDLRAAAGLAGMAMGLQPS